MFQRFKKCTWRVLQCLKDRFFLGHTVYLSNTARTRCELSRLSRENTDIFYAQRWFKEFESKYLVLKFFKSKY